MKTMVLSQYNTPLELHERGIPNDGDAVWLDTDVLEKIVGNLLTNAVKYTPPHGRVEISAPAGATPMITETPHPRCVHSSASRITCTLPVASNE